MNDNMEKALQERFTWERSGMFTDYNAILGYYQAKACLEHARGSSLLDMPCGDGAVTSMLAPSFSTVVGVDASSLTAAAAAAGGSAAFRSSIAGTSDFSFQVAI